MTARADRTAGGDAARRFLMHWLFTPLAGVTIGDWRQLRRRERLDIPPRYWPRAGFTMLMGVLNSILARREARRFDAEIARLRVRRPVFVLGHHRSGTTHLWNILSQDPRFAYPTVLQSVFPHTFLTFESVARGWTHRLGPRQRPQDNVAFGPDSPIEDERAICTSSFLSLQMARHFPRQREAFTKYLTMRDATAAERAAWKAALDTFARKLLIRHGHDKILLFKTPDHTAKIPLILELYPDARFVHIHRDPYEVFRSTRKMELDSLPAYAYQRFDPEDLDDYILWRYRAMYDAYLEDAKSLPADRLVEVAFADLEREPLAVVERIYRALDLPDFEAARPALTRYVESVSDYRKNVYKGLSTATRRKVDEAWRPYFALWGSPE